MNMKTKGRIFAIFATGVETLLEVFRGATDPDAERMAGKFDRRAGRKQTLRVLQRDESQTYDIITWESIVFTEKYSNAGRSGEMFVPFWN